MQNKNVVFCNRCLHEIFELCTIITHLWLDHYNFAQYDLWCTPFIHTRSSCFQAVRFSSASDCLLRFCRFRLLLFLDRTRRLLLHTHTRTHARTHACTHARARAARCATALPTFVSHELLNKCALHETVDNNFWLPQHDCTCTPQTLTFIVWKRAKWGIVTV